jgi:hypothetical protein
VAEGMQALQRLCYQCELVDGATATARFLADHLQGGHTQVIRCLDHLYGRSTCPVPKCRDLMSIPRWIGPCLDHQSSTLLVDRGRHN